jgi:F-type H+-transporting ATPase subunit c
LKIKKLSCFKKVLFCFFVLFMIGTSVFVYAASSEGQQADLSTVMDIAGMKAIAAAVAIGLGVLGGALAMGHAIAKSSESIARQPEAEGKIRTNLLLGLVFIETAIIYALVVAIMIIFVL